jgi:hypothetical protein
MLWYQIEYPTFGHSSAFLEVLVLRVITDRCHVWIQSHLGLHHRHDLLGIGNKLVLTQYM